MPAMAQLRYSPLAGRLSHNRYIQTPSASIPKVANFSNSSFFPLQSPSCTKKLNSSFLLPKLQDFQVPCAGGGDGSAGFNNGGGGGGGGGDSHDHDSKSGGGFGPIGAFLNGWRSRVAADPQFPFKVLMEELVGVSACVLGDMASRPNFGLNELDFVFSTLVVGSIMNFVLMYLLAPTAASTSQSLPSIFAACPSSHMFEPGAYGLVNRLGTFVYKGTVFAAVGFAAGLVGTAISNGLIKMRKKMDPNFETPNKPPPTVLNAVTWAIHMGLSSNFRYQTLNGIEYLLEKGLPPFVFKSSVVALRCMNNILGGMSFVILARLTGSQAVEEPKVAVVAAPAAAEKERLIADSADYLPNNGSSSRD